MSQKRKTKQNTNYSNNVVTSSAIYILTKSHRWWAGWRWFVSLFPLHVGHLVAQPLELDELTGCRVTVTKTLTLFTSGLWLLPFSLKSCFFYTVSFYCHRVSQTFSFHDLNKCTKLHQGEERLTENFPWSIQLCLSSYLHGTVRALRALGIQGQK